jgi:YVTN family beta-propeller protein
MSEYEFPFTPIENLGLEYIDCIQYSVPEASSRFDILGSLPSSITLSSVAPFVTQYGQPQMYVYDGTGTLVTQVGASSVEAGGASATFPFPSSLGQNAYGIAVVNQTGGGGVQPASYNLLSIASSQTIAGNPFGVSVGGQTDITVTCVYVPTPPYGGHNQCTSTSTYVSVPVVSLYSAGQVLIGGAAVNVGPNPTAVVAYPSNTITTTNGNVTITKAGWTRALVANSGSDTVTILDIVNDVPLATVTVGQQPVALAVASNGSTGYVANYTDSTVTQVNLTSDTATATVAVGGHPTSVALTAAGILWVGGAGFLTEINTANMSVVGTESVSGKTIVSLGYSDAYNELAVSSVDTSGNVYVEEVAASTFQAGAAYAPVASQAVSSVGTYLNPVTNTEVQGYTATLATASTSIINTYQPGAPPIVVQDGWAVITATPTGFTITDVSGNIVLVSQTTPSPITAIAVDPNLNIAYLTMPDSNILLTVPLPGVT